jgi:hypothetical protein
MFAQVQLELQTELAPGCHLKHMVKIGLASRVKTCNACVVALNKSPTKSRVF